MSITRKVAHNTIYQFIGKIVGTILALITAAMMLRYLGQEGFGEYTTIIGFLGIFSILADLGLYLVTTKEISRDDTDDSHIISNAFTIKLIFSVFILVLAPVVGFFFPYSQIVKWGIVIGAASFLFILLNQVLIGIFQKHFRMERVAIAEVAGRIVWLLGVIIAVKLSLSLLWIVGFIALSNFVNFTLVYFFARKHVTINLRFDFATWKYLMKIALPLALSVVLNLVYFKLDTVMLSVMKPATDVGIYGAAYKVLESLITFAAIFAGILLPLLARYAVSDPARFARIYKKGFDVLSIFIVPLIVGTVFLAHDIMVLFGGEDFAASSVVLQILIFAVGAIFFAHLFGNTVVAINQQRKIVWIYFSSAVISVVLNLLLIPRFTYFGAAITTVITEAVVFAGTLWVVWRIKKLFPSLRVFGKALVASLCMGAVLYLLPVFPFSFIANRTLASFFTLLVPAVIAGAVYFIILYLLKGISKDIVKEVISFKKEEKNA